MNPWEDALSHVFVTPVTFAVRRDKEPVGPGPYLWATSWKAWRWMESEMPEDVVLEAMPFVREAYVNGVANGMAEIVFGGWIRELWPLEEAQKRLRRLVPA